MKLCIHVRPRDDKQGWAVDVFDGRRAWTKTHLGESPLSKAEAHRLAHKLRDHLSSENASLAMQVESMAMRIESLAEELAKPEDVRLREVVDALDGRAVIFDGLGARVGHLLDEMDEWIARAGEAERRADEYDAKLTAVRVALTEAGVPEVEPSPEEDVSDHEKSLRAGGRVIGAVARIERLVARLAAAGDVVKMARQLVSYDWEARLDDSKTSDAAKHDARELSYAVYKYDRAAKS